MLMGERGSERDASALNRGVSEATASVRDLREENFETDW
jgi:hypothetical protein